MTQYTDIQPKKLENIALSFSGGGFRAASFGLGCLSYLNSVYAGGTKLTSLVGFISSASGGSITSLAYTAGQRRRQSFETFYVFMKEQVLSGTVLTDRVFEILGDDRCWKERPEKSRNLINAFSIAYDELIFDQAAFGIYMEPVDHVVKEICVNSTEFDNGMLFRFQNAGKTGNAFLHFKTDDQSAAVLSRLKLSDILACSSCFTVGFEPFLFPDDFTHAHLSRADLQASVRQNTRFSPEKSGTDPAPEIIFSLMDGGIDDNQGIDSFIRAEKRLDGKNQFGYDLYISCDVSSNYTSGYVFPRENKRNWFLKPSMLQYILLIVTLSAGALMAAQTACLEKLAYGVLGICLFLMALLTGLSFKGFAAYRKTVSNRNTFGIIFFKHLMYFLRLPVSVLIQMVASRATSSGYLAAVVFLKKIRRISYNRLFEKISERKYKADGTVWTPKEDASLVAEVRLKHWRQFSLQNAIYLLTTKNNLQRESDLKKEKWYTDNPSMRLHGKEVNLITLLSPSANLQNMADLAAGMDTTLWYDSFHTAEGRQEAVIAAGQFTTCYNLLCYALRFDRADPYWEAFQRQLAEDWLAFNQAPARMV